MKSAAHDGWSAQPGRAGSSKSATAKRTASPAGTTAQRQLPSSRCLGLLVPDPLASERPRSAYCRLRHSRAVCGNQHRIGANRWRPANFAIRCAEAEHRGECSSPPHKSQRCKKWARRHSASADICTHEPLRVAAINLCVGVDKRDTLSPRRLVVAAADGARYVALPECFVGKYGESTGSRGGRRRRGRRLGVSRPPPPPSRRPAASSSNTTESCGTRCRRLDRTGAS